MSWDVLPPSSKVPFAAGRYRFCLLLGRLRVFYRLRFSGVVRELAITEFARALSGKVAAYPEKVSKSEVGSLHIDLPRLIHDGYPRTGLFEG